MTKTVLKSIAVTAALGTAALSLPAPAEAGNALGAGLIGFGGFVPRAVIAHSPSELQRPDRLFLHL